MPLIWQESFLNDLAQDAEKDAAQRVNYLFTKFSLAITAGQSVYTLPSYTRSILRITWKGYKVWPISWREMCEIDPASMVASESEKVEATQSRPYYYCIHPNNERNIRFFPTPNETVASDDTKVWGTTGITDIICVSAWRTPDFETFVLPSYVSRRTKKAYALMMAFLKEGKGQNLKASAYYKSKYEFQINLLKSVVGGVFVSRRLRLSDQLRENPGRPGRPVYPANFPRD